MDASTCECVQVGGWSTRESLALTGLHLGDSPLSESRCREQLNVVEMDPTRSTKCLAEDGEGFDLGARCIRCFATNQCPNPIGLFA